MNGYLHPSDEESLILCAVDFSESSNRSLQWAVQMAQLLQAHLTILHTFRLIHPKGIEAMVMKRKKEEDAITNFTSLEKRMLEGKAVSYDFKTEVGFITDRIEDYSRKNSIHFLVLGNHLVETNKETFDELVKNIEIPLVIIP